MSVDDGGEVDFVALYLRREDRCYPEEPNSAFFNEDKLPTFQHTPQGLLGR